MTPKFLIFDDYNNAGQSVLVTRGEQRRLTLLFYKDSGIPLGIDNAYDEISVKVYTGVSSEPIEKTLTGTTVTEVKDDNLGTIGVTFLLTAADTTLITANSSGVPVKVTFSNSDVVSDELNFAEPIQIDEPVIS